MAGRSRRACIGAVLALILWPVLQASAEDPPSGQDDAQATPGVRVQGDPLGGGAEAQAGAGAGDQELRRRVEQLEEQLVDLQVVIGTLESLARTGGTRTPPLSGQALDVNPGGGEQSRLDGFETQIRALTAQVEQLSSEVRAQAGVPRRSDAGGLPGEGGSPDAAGGRPAGASRFGSTTVTSGTGDPIGNIISNGPPSSRDAVQPSQAGPPPAGPGQVAVLEPLPGVSSANPKQLYEIAYGYLLQQDYSSAQAGFGDFLKKYPKDPLAPNALYWLGEAHYVQRNYADAAEAFDLVTASFGDSAKAPDAQLKRGMALAQLGKQKDACAALRSLASKFPNAPEHVKSKAESERQRTGCP